MRNVYTTGVWNRRNTLETVDLQEGVTAIDKQAFSGITALTSVSMTADVKKIWGAAFWGCTSLKNLYFYGTLGQWNNMERVDTWKKFVPSTFQVHYRCTATFNMQGHGTAPAAQTVWNGEADVLTVPTNPSTQGYDFGGWYKDAACTQAFDFSAALNDNVTVYAKWTPLANTISFNLDNKGTPVADQTVYSGDRVTEPAMQFTETEGIEGWYTDAARQQRYDFNTPVDQSMTLYAKWAAAGTAIFNVTGGEHGTVTLTDVAGRTLTGEGRFFRGTCTLTVAPNDGYTYTGSHELFSNSGASTGSTPINGSRTQTYTLDLSNYNLTVSIDFGQQPVVSIIATTDGTATAGSYALTDQQPTPIDYTQGGVLQNVCDPNDPTVPDSLNLRLTVTKGENTGCAVTIVNNGAKQYVDYKNSFAFPPYGSVAIELFFYDTTAGVLNLADNGQNADLINAADGKRRMVTLSGRTLKRDGNWNTLCLPFDYDIATGSPLDKTDVKLMELDTEAGGFDNGTLYLNFKEVSPSDGQGRHIEAGKPYIIKWKKPSKYDQNPGNYDITSPTFSSVTIRSAAPTAVMSQDGTVGFVGSYSPVSLSANADTLYLGDGNTLHYPSQDMPLNGFRAYFQLGNSLTTSSRGDVNDDGETSISDVVYVVKYLMDNDDTHFVVANADVDQSSSIDIGDAAALVDLILDGTNKHILKNVVISIDNTPTYGGAGSSNAK